MELKRVQGVNVDICEEHGAWLDKGEIESIIEASKTTGVNEGFARSLWSEF